MSNDRTDGTGSEWWDEPNASDKAAAADQSADASQGSAANSAGGNSGESETSEIKPISDDSRADSHEDIEEKDKDVASPGDDESNEEGTSNRHRILKWLGLAAVLVILFPLVIFGVAYLATDVPDPEELANDQIAIIYDRTGEKELTRIVPEGGNRRNVDLSEVPDPVRNAVLAAEDREFYTNPGFSLSGYARAALGVVTGNSSAGGGSTITQQYVKNAVVGNERTITRKAKELVMSAKMAQEWSKDDILEAYLNTIYFGRNAYGIAAAAKAYFGKEIKDLNTEEGAVLAAAIQRPSALDPWANRPEAEQRWNYVLDGLVSMSVLSPADRANMKYPDTIDPATAPEQAPEPGPAAMIKGQVLAELEREGISEQEVNTGGLRITTTIDPVVQKAALDAVNNYVYLDSGQRAAIVSVEPKTGAVRAYYGGDDPNGWDYAGSGLQTGSTFKIFALAAALDQGITLNAQYSSAPVQVGDATIENSDGAGGGVMSISEALRLSLNTPFIRLQEDLKRGPDDTATMAHKLGVAESIPGIEKTLMEENGHSQAGIALGQYLTRPLDMAVGLATLTNDGVLQKTHFVEKVENSEGDILFEHKDSDGDRRVSKAVATNVISAMQPIAAHANHVLAGGRASAAKTGTAQLGDTGNNKDAWMIGSTPQLSTAVWMGMVDGSALYNDYGGIMYGANKPADLWKYTMDNALANEDFESFSEPEAINGVAGAQNYQAPVQTYTPEYTEEYTEAPTSSTPTSESTPEPSSTPQPVQPPSNPNPLPQAPSLNDLLQIPGLGGGNGGAGAPAPAPAPAGGAAAGTPTGTGTTSGQGRP